MKSNYYSLDVKQNVLRCRTDKHFLGEVLIANENLIWHSIHKYIGNPDYLVRNTCIDKDDLLQVGRIGYIKAVHAFDTDRGVKFSSFAVVAIVREVRCFIRDHVNAIRPTRTANDLINRIKRLESDLGYLPNPTTISEMLDVDVDKIIKALQVGQTVKYLEEPVTNPQKVSGFQSTTLLDLIKDSNDVEGEVVTKVYAEGLIEWVQAALTEKERRIFQHRLNGLNQTQVAKLEDVSQMKVSRVMKKIAELIKTRQKALNN